MPSAWKAAQNWFHQPWPTSHLKKAMTSSLSDFSTKSDLKAASSTLSDCFISASKSLVTCSRFTLFRVSAIAKFTRPAGRRKLSCPEYQVFVQKCELKCELD